MHSTRRKIFLRGTFASSLVLIAACSTPPAVDADTGVDARDVAADAPTMDVAPDTMGTDASDAVVPDVPSMDVVDAVSDTPADEGCDGSLCSGACVDTRSDPMHCGGCTTDCTALPHVAGAVSCAAGACVLSGACAAGFADCDGNASNGCETSLSDATNCGACGVICTGATPMCTSSGSTYVCASACTVTTEIRCAGACIDPQTDVANCGSCSNACPVPAHGTASCTAATCGFTCSAGYHACSAMCADDTSPLTCGTLCTPCPEPANATRTCSAGVCGFVCNPGFELVGTATCSPIAPRPIAPLSTATVTSRRPTLRWSLATATTGAQVEVCRDRACTMSVTTFMGTTSAAPSADLPTGLLFWRLRGMVGTEVGLNPGPTWELNVGARSAAIDSSFGSIADVDGDGYADVLVGAPSANSSTGAAYAYPGSATGVSTTASFIGTGPDGYGGIYGDSVANAGDVNGDGFVDMIVGAGHAFSLRGRAYIYLGSSSGPVRPAATTLSGPSTPGSDFGVAVASAGDVNGDGYADVIVGADRGDFGVGHAYLYLGAASGLSTTAAVTLSGSGDSNGEFGTSVASAGDVNADGYADVLIGAPGEMTGAGRVYLYLGSPTGLRTTASLTIDGRDGSTGNFGDTVAGVGDLDGDGRSDVIASAPNGGSGGSVYVYLGTSTGIASTAARVLTSAAGTSAAFAASAAGAGDVNGDGYADVIVGVLAQTSGADQVQLFLGGAGGIAGTPASTVYSPDGSGYYFATASASAGDVDRDGFADIIVGEWRINMAGRAFVFRGSAAGLLPTPVTTLNGPALSSSDFGSAVGGAAW